MNDPIFFSDEGTAHPQPGGPGRLEEGLSRCPSPRPPPPVPVLGAGRLPPSGGRPAAGTRPPLSAPPQLCDGGGKRRGQEQDASTQEAAPCPGLIISEADLDRTPSPTEEGGAVRPQPASRLRPGRRLPCPAAVQCGGRDLFRCRHRRGRPAPGAPDSGDPTGIRQRHLPGLVRRRLSGQRGEMWWSCWSRAATHRPCAVRSGTGLGAGCPLPGPLLPRLPHQAPGADLCPALSEGGAVLLRPGRGEQPSGPVLTRADDEALSALAVLDPRDDAVYVQAAAPASAESGTGTACPGPPASCALDRPLSHIVRAPRTAGSPSVMQISATGPSRIGGRIPPAGLCRWSRQRWREIRW